MGRHRTNVGYDVGKRRSAMIYLSQLLGNPIRDSAGETIGTVSDLGIATGEVFPRITSLAFMGPGRTPFMISWRKYVQSYDTDSVTLRVTATDLRFSYLQPSELLIARDLLNKQIVDTRGMRVVRVNDLKLSDTSSAQLRLLGAEVGVRGLLRSLSPQLERIVCRAARTLGHPIPERIIAWNYMDLIERDLSNVKLSVSHKTLDELHPADIADIIEQLDPRLRGQVFAQLDDERAAEAVAELDDDEMAAELVGTMGDDAASRVLSEMDPDDAAELVGELGVEKAEKLLRLMGVKEQRAIRQLLGYHEGTAGRIMTSEFVSLAETASVEDAITAVAKLDDDFETVHYVYATAADGKLAGVVNLRQLISADPAMQLRDLATTDIVTAAPEDDQEDVAESIAKYNLLAMPVVDENRQLIGIVTVDDALEVMQEEHEEDLRIAGGTHDLGSDADKNHALARFLASEMWVFFWLLGGFVLCRLAQKLVGDGLAGLAAAIAMPVALRAVVTMVRSVTSFFLEYDANDEDAPSTLGFVIRGVLVASAYTLVVVLLARTGIKALALGALNRPGIGPDDSMVRSLAMATDIGFVSAAIATIISHLTSPAYLVVLRHRDDVGKEINGLMVRAIALSIALVLFIGIALALLYTTMPQGGVA